MKRGPNAWVRAFFRLVVGCTENGANPLLVHAVQDDTLRYTYLPAVKKWLSWIDTNSIRVQLTAERDKAMSDYFAWMCYRKSRHPSAGKATLAGYVHLYPEHGDQMK